MLWLRKQVFGHNTVMKPAQLKYQKTSSKHVRRPMDNFVYWIYHFYLLPTHQCVYVYQLYMPRSRTVSRRQVFPTNYKMASSVSIPASIAPNVWIITSSTTAVPSGITLICPREAPRTITLQTPIHILSTATSMQCYVTGFSPATTLWITWSYYKYLTEHSKSLCCQCIITRI